MILRTKSLILVLLAMLFILSNAYARSGCCSWHGGVNHCDNGSGRIVCNDGTYSPSCMCEPNSKNPRFRPDAEGQHPNQNYQLKE